MKKKQIHRIKHPVIARFQRIKQWETGRSEGSSK